MQKSAAIPYLDKPPALDGSMEGDVGFDPLWVSSALPDKGWIKYLREAELKHGRVAMLAATGAIFQDLVQFQGTDTLVGSAKMTGAHDALLKLEYTKGSSVATMHQASSPKKDGHVHREIYYGADFSERVH